MNEDKQTFISKNAIHSMKTVEKLTKEILETTGSIQEHYPELSKFLDEMTVTIPSEAKPEITVVTLKAYNDSLQAMANGYAKSSISRIGIIEDGFAGLILARMLNNHPNYNIT